jgi:Domain of unknown function (DUF4395)
MPVDPTVRSRLEAQGFCGLDDETLTKLAPWMRWTYTLGTLVTLVGVVVMSPAVLWTLAAITCAGIFLPFHPFDLLYNYGLRYLTRTGPFPNSGPQRRFVFVVATGWLIATGWAFSTGADIFGIVLGVPLIVVGALASVTNFCIPSWIYNTVAARRSREGV